MEIEKLLYKKGTGKLSLRQAQSVSLSLVSNSVAGTMRAAKKMHVKSAAVLLPAVVYVLSGGEEREKNYLKYLKSDPIFSSCVQVLFQSEKGQGLTPRQMDEKWQKARKGGKIKVDNREYGLSSVDMVYLVSDVDEFESQLVDILKKKDKADKGQWIISNPCIEIWLYYCFLATLDPQVLRLRYVSRAHRSQQMKLLNDQLISGGADPRKAFDNTPMGIVNSKAHYRIGYYGIPRVFATSFHIMMEQILDFVKERGRSFAEYQDAKRKRIELYLKKQGIK